MGPQVSHWVAQGVPQGDSWSRTAPSEDAPKCAKTIVYMTFVFVQPQVRSNKTQGYIQQRIMRNAETSVCVTYGALGLPQGRPRTCQGRPSNLQGCPKDPQDPCKDALVTPRASQEQPQETQRPPKEPLNIPKDVPRAHKKAESSPSTSKDVQTTHQGPQGPPRDWKYMKMQ